MKYTHIKHFVVFSFILLSISCNRNNGDITKELKSVLSNLSTSSFFIAVDITCGSETYPVVVPNHSFYNMLLQRGIVKSQEGYIDKMINNIVKKEPVMFDTKDSEMIKGYSVIKDDTLNISLKKDKTGLIRKYFVDNKLKTSEVSYMQRKAIIYYLFNNRTYCRMDCVSGTIFIVPILPVSSSFRR